MSQNKSATVLYHANCADGTAAAWVLYKFFGDRAEYIPCNYGFKPDLSSDIFYDKRIYLVDYSLPNDILLELASQNEKVTVLDHHKSAIEEMMKISYIPENLDLASCTVEHSGCMIAWKHFFVGDPPLLLKLIEDRDLWKFTFGDLTKNSTMGLFSYGFEIETYDKFMSLDISGISSLVNDGRAIKRAHDNNLKSLLKQSKRYMQIDEFNVPCANLSPIFASDAGGILCEGYPFAATYFDTEKSRVFSLRSKPEGEDVSVIAKRFGGGGHKNAAGFTVPRSHDLAKS